MFIIKEEFNLMNINDYILNNFGGALGTKIFHF